MIDTRQLAETAPAPLVQKWRNLYFTTDSRTYWGSVLHNTKLECIVTSTGFFSEWIEYIAGGGAEPVDMFNGDLVPFELISFAVPMPWRTA